ncbi:hypothetical protein HOLleu_30742 [Holothuria leucospilota]|uniref:Uncharacterized protein n=1 Tax=Holothuria leucospilota TaxID=206669 RepID=A0A9Q1BL14_HOLLE|nr:hypothetical protein HOLleu_30742 [Holothuria leucospilota]
MDSILIFIQVVIWGGFSARDVICGPMRTVLEHSERPNFYAMTVMSKLFIECVWVEWLVWGWGKRKGLPILISLIKSLMFFKKQKSI